MQEVLSGTSPDDFVTLTAPQLVVAEATHDGVVARVTVNVIVAGVDQNRRAIAACHRVVSGGCTEKVFESEKSAAVPSVTITPPSCVGKSARESMLCAPGRADDEDVTSQSTFELQCELLSA